MKKRSIIISSAVLILVVVAFVLGAPLAIRKAESIRRGNFMVSIGSAARMWASDRDGYLPSDLVSISNEVVTTKLLVCPGDQSRRPAANWTTFTPADSSYEIVTPHLAIDDTNRVFLRCKIHGLVGYGDGSVYDGVRRRRKIP